jgi:hypothetical protein
MLDMINPQKGIDLINNKYILSLSTKGDKNILCSYTKVTGSFPPPPRFEAPKLDPGGCVPEATSEARLKKRKRDSP